MRNGTLILLGVLLAACFVACSLAADVDREDVQLAGKEAGKALNEKLRGKYQHRLKRVVRAQVQSVGDSTEFKMQLIVGMTTCLRAEELDDECEFQDNISTYKKCDVLVRRDSNGNYKLVTSGCILAPRSEV